MKLRLLVQIIACLTLASGVAHADANEIQGTTANADDMKKTEGADGWSHSLKFSGTGSYAQHKSHLTETNGETYNFGGKLDGAATWRMGSKEWRTSLLVDYGTQKDPNVKRWIKTSDLFKIESIYLWGLEGMPKFGPYVKGSFDTALFENRQLFAKPGVTVDGVAGTTKAKLSEGLGDNPMTLKGSAGVFYKAIEKENMNLVLTAGLGMMRVWANSLALTEDANTAGVYTTSMLQDYTDYGLVLGLDWRGKIDAKTSYQVGFESLTPFDKDEDNFAGFDDLSLIEITNYNAFAKIDTKLYDFLSLGYEYRIKMQPKLQRKEQISNLLNLSLTYILL